MMYVPSVFKNSLVEDLFDDVFGTPANEAYRKSVPQVMKTDVKDLGNQYQLEVELPGYDKENLHADLQNGYLVISAKKEENTEEKDEKGGYIRRERYTGECRRSFYVGKQIKEEDIQASFENGILKLIVPKEDALPKVEEKKAITIS